MKLRQQGCCWLVQNDSNVPVAEIHLDYLEQVEAVVFTGGTAKEQRMVRELACYHFASFVIERHSSVMGGLMVMTTKNSKLSRSDSSRFMDFDQIPQKIKDLPDAEIDRALKPHVRALVAVCDAKSAIQKAIQSATLRTGVEFDVATEEDWLGELYVVIGSKTAPFRFWKSLCFYDHKNLENQYHIVPHYHPECGKQREEAFLINGDTDYNIGGECVKHVHPPENSAETREKQLPSFGDVLHPFKAEGNTFVVSVDKLSVRTKEGMDELARFIEAALDRDTYIAVSGGFHSPYTYPSNLEGRRNCKVVGSEHIMVWEYETLEKEGVISQAIVPPWFIEQKWLESFKNAPAHGVEKEQEWYKDLFRQK